MALNWSVLAVLLFLPINPVEAYAAHNRVSVEAGHEAVLSCPYTSNASLVLVTWKRNCSSCCLLSYRRDHNETSRLNCSERITWKYPPASDPVLRIYPVNLGDEGNYTCEIASSEGNHNFLSSLTVTDTCHRLLYILVGTATGVSAATGVALCLIFRCRACWLCKQAPDPAEHSTTKTCKFPPSRARREAAKPPDFSEKIYQNYNPRSVYVYL